MRILLFLGTNFAVMAVLLVFTRIFGFDAYITAEGLDYTSLIGFCAVFGFGGSFISLLTSKWIARLTTRAKIINDSPDPKHAAIVSMVKKYAMAANIGMPDVAVYEGAPNAFATGPTRNNSLVAVSTGLLQMMNQEELDAVIGHEVAHISNGDMVTMALLQGVLNTFVLVISRIVAFTIAQVISRGQGGRAFNSGVFFITTIILDIVLGVLAHMIVAWFSRRREFRADAGSAQMHGTALPMANALRRLGGIDTPELPSSLRSFGIAGGGMRLFSSHPPIEQRIKALEELRITP